MSGDTVKTKPVQTLGQMRVRTSFNPSDDSVVDQIKIKSAVLIDLLEAVRADEVSKTYEQSRDAMLELSGEKLRLIDIAQKAYEDAAMWAVKAVTC